MSKRIVFFFILCFSSIGLLAQEKTKKVYRPDIPGSFLIDFGFNSGQSKPQGFTQGFWGSRTLNIYYHYPVRIGETKFTYNPGGGFSFERFKFTNNYTLVLQTDGTYLLEDPTSILQSSTIKKSMLVANYFDLMPLEFRFDTNPKDVSRSFSVSIGARVGFLIESHTKINYTTNGVSETLKNKQNNGLNTFRYGVYGRIGIGNFNVFGFYNISPYFATNKGPLNNTTTDLNHTTMNTLTLGISLNGF
ncbi:MAG: hypothetical protein HYR67_03875 [Bacteroidetes bacterium]|nr:hypothetical protein [Bacteroidota bacterium]